MTDDNKEIDGWVYEWTCSQCECELTIGVTNDDPDKVHPEMSYCPQCSHEVDGEEVHMHTIYTDELSEVWKHIKRTAGNGKVAAIKELRKLRKDKGDGRDDLKSCEEDIERMIQQYNDVKGVPF